MKAFNTAGTCRPNEHYMVDITERLEIIRKMVAKGDYFCINRGRQYGKTTTLAALQTTLEKLGYTVFSLSFEGIAGDSFLNLNTVLFKLVQKINDCILWDEVKNISETSKVLLDELEKSSDASIDDVVFSRTISRMCKTEKAILLIDEVDQASNSASFIQFLGLLREMYLKRDTRPTFQSVILAGVYDIKNLKLKMRSEEQHQYNSPWNIAVPFDVDMSLSAEGIAGMLAEYKADHGFDKLTNHGSDKLTNHGSDKLTNHGFDKLTNHGFDKLTNHGFNFDEKAVAQMIRDYTSGYPYLVSRICQIIDAEQWTWDKDGVLKAVNALLDCGESFWMEAKQIIDNDLDLKDLLQSVIAGQYVCYEPYAKGMKAALEHDYIKRMKTPVEIASPLHKGYLLSFCFNKDKQPGLLPPVELNGRTLIEAIV